jgi:ubiquinone/menaquinone biosynthesis C-methylase UbiE
MPQIETTFRIAADAHENVAAYLLYRRHLFAYEEACRRISPGSVVADVGCGYGYALEMLLTKAARVLAIDAADTALNNLPDLPNVEKIKAYANSIPLPDESIDCVVAFQLLEHVPPADVRSTLNELLRITRSGGHIYATTPNARWRLYRGQRPWNPYHEKEYWPEEIEALCRREIRHAYKLQSVVGTESAQKIELARVAPDPLVHFGRNLGGYARKIWQRFGPPRLGHWKACGKRSISEDDLKRAWFRLSADHAEGLDFWLEIHKA